jgi:hypothetical protein
MAQQHHLAPRFHTQCPVSGLRVCRRSECAPADKHIDSIHLYMLEQMWRHSGRQAIPHPSAPTTTTTCDDVVSVPLRVLDHRVSRFVDRAGSLENWCSLQCMLCGLGGLGLLRCHDCGKSVHLSCVGLDGVLVDKWQCSECRVCSLCFTRGGDLCRGCGRYLHTSCTQTCPYCHQ